MNRAQSNEPLAEWQRRMRLGRRIRAFRDFVSLPFTVFMLLSRTDFHPSYRLTWPRRMRLGLRMYRNARAMTSGTSHKSHLVMAAKILTIPPDVEGVVVECGCWLGGATVNLSLVCEIVGRELVVFDTFEGLPEAEPGERAAAPHSAGQLAGPIDQVKANVQRYGAIEVCRFEKGLFADTLPTLGEPVVACFIDADYEASIYDCVVNLWPRLVDQGYFFVDDYVTLDYCAVFWSESFWREHFDRTPPGLVGSGTGVGVGHFFTGPATAAFGIDPGAPFQAADSVAFTRKDLSGHWGYRPPSD